LSLGEADINVRSDSHPEAPDCTVSCTEWCRFW
jgi:hypothetical protein